MSWTKTALLMLKIQKDKKEKGQWPCCGKVYGGPHSSECHTQGDISERYTP